MKVIRIVFLGFMAVVAVLAADGKKDRAPKRPRGHITIGKETTYVTGPLDKDGYVDYTAALNKRLRGDTTPANNANVLLWKALGPHPEGPAVPPEFFELLGIKPPPERGDYFIDLARYVRKHLKADPGPGDFSMAPGGEGDAIEEQTSRVTKRPWTAKEYPHVAAWLKANEKPLGLVIEATRRSHYYSPLVAWTTKEGRGALLVSPMPGVQECRGLATALTARAMLRVAVGAYDDAWQDLLACHRLGRLVGRGSTLMEALVGLAIDNVAGQADLAYLDRGKPNAKRLAACLRDLRNLPPLPDVAEKEELCGRFILLETIQMIDRHGIGYLEALEAKGDRTPRKKSEPVVDMVLADIDWDPALRTINRWHDRLVAALREKDRRVRAKQLTQFVEELQALHRDVRDKKKRGKLILGAKELGKAWGKYIGDVLVALMMPAAHKVQDASDRIRQNHDNLLLAFALARYRREHGRYPKALDALAPKYLPAVPQDRFSGNTLVYRPSADGYLLYSVGVNGKDEGGKGSTDTSPGDDLAVRMPLPKLPRN